MYYLNLSNLSALNKCLLTGPCSGNRPRVTCSFRIRAQIKGKNARTSGIEIAVGNGVRVNGVKMAV